ncbi:helix-turn-helix domain-containing protein [Prevotella sp. 10(H)]|uniref:helix-turn-helix domain-containing protein n=1 Tax=Prevotella sp. 10(H) TaxID=1158294 RepID=UPI0004A719D9|nr:helix-turn-helix domain-containing protein [Prevotella sp. 10(H)]
MKSKNEIRNAIISKIRDCAPAHINLTDYVQGILGLSRVSVFRRLKGEISFTYEEIVILAKEMNFSVDELIYLNSKNKHLFEMNGHVEDNMESIILKTLQLHYEELEEEKSANQRSTIIISNHLWFVYTLHFENLFKFYYYKFIYQWHPERIKDRMKDIEVLPEIKDIKNKVKDMRHNLSQGVWEYIIDRYIFLNTMQEIQYYYRRGLLDENELTDIAMDLKQLLKYIESEIGQNKSYARRHQYYISDRKIYINSASVENDDKIYGLIFPNELHPTICRDQNLCTLHRHYLETYKRQSKFISGTNEELQISFFEKQYAYVEDLMANKDLIN